MKSFFKIFFAALLAIIVFSILAVFFLAGMAGSALSKDAPQVAGNSILVIDLKNHFEEQSKVEFNSIANYKGIIDKPGLFDVIRLINAAKTDDHIKGVLIKADGNANSFASSEELRDAVRDFKTSKKPVWAYGDIMSETAYYVANIADKVYVSPQGNFEWTGFSVNYTFLKGTLDKLEIKPQIFYAGKFKSATEPFRAEKMSDANKLQTSVWLNQIYADLLNKTAASRAIDSAVLHQLANTAAIQTPQDAVANKLIDGVKYDDELQDEIKKKLNIDKTEKINFITIEKYAKSGKKISGSGDKIALIYAYGDVIDGKSQQGSIGSATYVELLRKARLDDNIKAIVLRVNSGGGSALASENIWREVYLAKQVKPVMVSYGDVAASGGYYLSCAADSIFALPTTITGSIGVFGIIPDMSSFFKNKMGVTFDGVKTGPYANFPNIDHAMNEQEKKIITTSIENIYHQFKQRVAEGRKKDTAYVETIAQGRIWTGMEAKKIGLVDKLGGLQDAIKAAAAKAKITDYQIVEYPKQGNLFEQLFGFNREDAVDEKIKNELGEEYFKTFIQVRNIKRMTESIQAKIPFEFAIK